MSEFQLVWSPKSKSKTIRANITTSSTVATVVNGRSRPTDRNLSILGEAVSAGRCCGYFRAREQSVNIDYAIAMLLTPGLQQIAIFEQGTQLQVDWSNSVAVRVPSHRWIDRVSAKARTAITNAPKNPSICARSRTDGRTSVTDYNTSVMNDWRLIIIIAV